MTLKNKLQQLNTSNESNQKLELQMKEQSENEKVLEQLAKEFEELSKELEG